MRKLRRESYHSVMLARRCYTYLRKADLFCKIGQKINGGLWRAARYDYITRALKKLCVRCVIRKFFFARHWVRPAERQPVFAAYFRHFFAQLAFYSAHIGDHAVFFELFGVVFHKFRNMIGVRAHKHNVGVFKAVGCSDFVYRTFGKCFFKCGVSSVYSNYVVVGIFDERFCQRPANNSKTNYYNIHI